MSLQTHCETSVTCDFCYYSEKYKNGSLACDQLIGGSDHEVPRGWGLITWAVCDVGWVVHDMCPLCMESLRKDFAVRKESRL